MKKLLFAILVVCFLPKLALAQNEHLVISQVQITGGPGKTTNDFVEIYNPTDTDIDLNGLRLVKRSQDGESDTLLKSWTSSTIVKAHGFYLWANSNFSEIAVVPDAATSDSLSDNNGVALRYGPNDTGEIIDSVAWGTSVNSFVEGNVFAANPQNGESMARQQDTNDNSADFLIQVPNPHNSSFAPEPEGDVDSEEEEETQGNDEPQDPEPTTPDPTDQTEVPTPTPTPAPTPTPNPAPFVGSGAAWYSSALIISEFVPNPDGPDAGEEWVEIYNPTDASIDVGGWILDDEGKDGVTGSSSYRIPAGTSIPAQGYLVVSLPEGVFALDNSGTDAIRLIWPSKQTAAIVAYSGTVRADWSYARQTDGTYDWTQTLTPGFANEFVVISEEESKPESESDPAPVDYSSYKLVINEIFPNPAGADSGQEWIEIFNAGNTTVSVAGWVLDDGAIEDPIGSTAYRLGDLPVSPGQAVSVIIPSGKFALNNSGSETVRLFGPDKELVDNVTYEGAKENLSFANFVDGWDWGVPTPNVQNTKPQIQQSLVIAEILPYPLKDGEEYIVIKNISENEVDLTGYKLKAKNGIYEISNGNLGPGQTIRIHRTQSGIALTNSASEKLELIAPTGMVVSAVEYEDAPRGAIFALADNGDYVWTGGSKQTGKVAGKSLVRTGNPAADETSPVLYYFAIFVIFWYIVGRLLNFDERETNE